MRRLFEHYRPPRRPASRVAPATRPAGSPTRNDTFWHGVAVAVLPALLTVAALVIGAVRWMEWSAR